MTAARAIAVSLALVVFLPSAADARPLQFGAWTPGDPYAGHTDGSDALEAMTGRRVAIVHWYQNWGGGAWASAVQPHALAAVAAGERTPMLTWEPWARGAGTDQPAYALARIAAGDFDDYIASWAVALKASGSPVYLRPMHEMNGDWYPWGGTVNGNSPALFVQAWRHMVDIFRRHEANNVRFVWSTSNFDVPASNVMEAYYPGAAYVDVLAVSCYNWGAGTPEFGGWQSFSEIFQRAYDRLRALGPQPVWVAEVGSSADGGDKAAWIRDMFATARGMDRLQAIVWFNEHKERDWRAAPSPEIAAAFQPAADDVPAPAKPGATRILPGGGGTGEFSSDGTTSSGVAEDGDSSTSGGTTRSLASAQAPAPAPAGTPPSPAGADATRATDANGATTTADRPRLQLTLNRPRVGGSGIVRWRASRSTRVKRFRAYLNGRLVRDTGVASRVARKRIARPGRYRWTVVARDAGGRTIVSGSRSFRVKR